MDLSDQLVRRHVMRNPDHERCLPWISEHRQVIEHDDVRIGHGAVEDIDKARGLLDVIAANLERSPIRVAGRRIIGNEQDAGRAAGWVHCYVIIQFPPGRALGRSA